jgi:transposase InsO family protein
VACEVHDRQTPEIAAEVIERACRAGGRPTHLHADNGAAQKGIAMHVKLERLGISPSHSRPAVSDDNPHIESLFKARKTQPLYPKKSFKHLEHAQEWAREFTQYYNQERPHGALGFVTPHQRHEGQDVEILARRRAFFEQLKAERPDRWSHPDRDIWAHEKTVWLNPDQNDERNPDMRQLS